MSQLGFGAVDMLETSGGQKIIKFSILLFHGEAH